MPFNDIISANAPYAASHQELASGLARRGLAVVTCIDSRIDPLAALGLIPGDAKIIRNAGARVTDDVLRSLIIATHVLGVNRVALMQHTDCGVAKNTQQSIEQVVEGITGRSARHVDFMTIDDQREVLREDAQRLRRCELFPEGIEVGEFIFDVRTGKIEQLG